MSEFPWAAVLSAIAAVSVAAIPVAVSYGMRSRTEGAANLLKKVTEIAPQSTAAAALSDLLDMQTVRFLARAKFGGMPWLAAASIGSVTILSLLIATAASGPNWWLIGAWLFNFLVSTALLIERYVKYASFVKSRLATSPAP